MQRAAPGSVVTAAALAAALCSLGLAPAPEDDLLVRIHQGMSLFGKVYREVAAGYVDDVDPETFMEAGIGGMLQMLDPYTVYIPPENGDEVEILTTGTYGGIGVTIGLRDGAVQVTSVLDGYSAHREGVQVGDRILSVDGRPVGSRKPEEIRILTRGRPGTGLTMSVEREGEAQPVTFRLMREEIRLRNITYAGFPEDGIGYVRLERFSRRAGEDLRRALQELAARDTVEALVLDMRGNPGGLLEAAVEVVSKFVPRGSLVVHTRGRRAEAERRYVTTEEPLMGDVPLVVLADRGSASASEIVAGALQDMDRALVVGTRTFGKGLVQTVVPLGGGAQLKVTTARYYVPSGRSIQEVEYAREGKGGTGSGPTDSTRREFRTAGGRRVFERGGIAPDSTVEPADPGPLVRQMQRRGLFARFAARQAQAGAGPPGAEEDSLLAAFRAYLEAQKFVYRGEGERKAQELLELAGEMDYGGEVREEIEHLRRRLAEEGGREFGRSERAIRRELGIETGARTGGESGRIGASLRGDPQVEAALGLLRSPPLLRRMLGG
ncbi:MAG: S41 family peptidase [Bacteroidota bacterium]